MVPPTEIVSSRLTTNKICEVHHATATFLNKLTRLTLALHPSDDCASAHASMDQQKLQKLLDNLKHWTNELDAISAQSITPSPASSTSAGSSASNQPFPTNLVQTPVSTNPIKSLPKTHVQLATPSTIPAVPVPNSQNGLASFQSMLSLAKKAPNTIGPTGTAPPMLAFAMRNSLARAKSSPMSPRQIAAGTCGISVALGTRSTGKHLQRREQRQLMRRFGPSNAYLSAGSKLYLQQQQQQTIQTPAVPPSNAYLSAGSKLAFRPNTLQQQQLRLIKRQQQQKLGAPLPVGCSSNTGRDDGDDNAQQQTMDTDCGQHGQQQQQKQ